MKCRLELKKVDKSDALSAVVVKARRELNACYFLFWLHAYLKPRKTRRNIPDNISDVSTECDHEESCHKNVQKDEFAQQESDEVETTDQINNKRQKLETEVKKVKKNEN